MTIKYKFLLCMVLISFFTLSYGYALEIGTYFSIGNLAFDDERVSTDTDFTGLSFPWGINAYINQDLSDVFSLQTGFYMDPILQNLSSTMFTYKQNYFSIGVGPFFGLFNSTTSLLKAGISTSIRLELPGIIFVSFRADSTIGGRLVQTGDYIQERSDIILGYYVKNAICSLNLFTKKYTAKTDLGETIDSLTEYSFKADIFKKNVPYKVLLSFGFQELSKTFIEGDVTTEHALGSLVVGTKVDIFIKDFLTVFIDMDNSVYTFGMEDLLGISNPGPAGGYLFRLSTGVSFNIDNLPKKK